MAEFGLRLGQGYIWHAAGKGGTIIKEIVVTFYVTKKRYYRMRPSEWKQKPKVEETTKKENPPQAEQQTDVKADDKGRSVCFFIALQYTDN